MKIVSNNSKLLDEVFDDLNIKGFKIEKVEGEKEEGSMDAGLVVDALLILATVDQLANLHDYFEKRFKKFSNVVNFKKNTKEISFLEYSGMSESNRMVVLAEYDILIKK